MASSSSRSRSSWRAASRAWERSIGGGLEKMDVPVLKMTRTRLRSVSQQGVRSQTEPNAPLEQDGQPTKLEQVSNDQDRTVEHLLASTARAREHDEQRDDAERCHHQIG